MKYPKLFLDSGYINMADIIEMPLPFIFVTGARRTGKTFGSIKYVIENNIPYIYMRRSGNELDACALEEFSPYKDINAKLGTDIHGQKLGKNAMGFYDMKDGQKVLHAPGLALSTLHNLRGISGDPYRLIIYDEFIPEKTARPIKAEFDAWSNAYETLNSNRELEGREPIKMVMLANSNMAANPLFMGLGLVRQLERMKRGGIIFWADEQRGILIVNVEGSPISEKKKNTALGRLTAGTDFARMAYDNDFAFDDFSGIGSRSLKEFKPIKSVGEICIYKHKSRREYYVSEHIAGAPERYGNSDREIEAFSRGAGALRDAYLAGCITFENYLTKVLFVKYTNY